MNQSQLDAYHGHLDFARLRVTKSRFVQPWERGFLKRPNPFPSCPPAPMEGGALSASSLEKRRAEQDLSQYEYESLGQYFKQFRSKLARKAQQSWTSKLDYDRKAAFVKWEKILLTALLDFQAGVQFRQVRLANRLPNIQQYFNDVFALKSTLTLHTRANPVLRYLKWCVQQGVPGIPFKEDEIYGYLTDHNNGFAPTFPKSLIGSLAFMYYVLECKSAKACIDRKSLVGCAARQYPKKRKLRQKWPLLVKQVKALERICIGEVEADLEEKVASGFFLFMLYSRARHSDAQAAGMISLDVVELEDGIDGFVETCIERSKTSYNLERKTRYLPMSAPVNGLLRHDSWAVHWFKNMDEAKLPQGRDRPLLPSPLRNGGWNKLPLTAEASTAWLRHLLIKSGTPKSDLLHYGSHSLKATVLSWLSKRGVPREIRAALGYHAKAVDGTEVVYGRDNMSAPLRVMNSVLDEIVDGNFMPDATKSGMLKKGINIAESFNVYPRRAELHSGEGGEDFSGLEVDAGRKADLQEISDDEISDFSDSEESCDESEPDHDDTETAIAAVVGRWRPIDDMDAESTAVYVRHSISRMLHVAADEYTDRFMCGRDLSPVYFKLDAKPKVFHPMCAQCLRVLHKHAKTVKQAVKP